MSRKWWSSLATVFILTLASVGAVFFLHERQLQAHFYLGVSGGNANVKLGALDLGAAPIKDATLPGGWYELQLHTDYYDYTLPIRLHPQTATVVDWQTSTSLAASGGVVYELAPTGTKDTTVSVTTSPDKAQLTIDNHHQELFAPLADLQVTPGVHQLQVSLPGYDTLTLPFTATSGYQLKLTIKLAQADDVAQ